MLLGVLFAAYLAARPDAPPTLPVTASWPPFPQVAARENAYPRYLAAARELHWPAASRPEPEASLRGDPGRTGAAWRAAVAANVDGLALLRRATEAQAFAAGEADAARRGQAPSFEGLTPLMRLADADLRQALADGAWASALRRTEDLVVLGRRLLYAPYVRSYATLQGAGLLRRTAAAWREPRRWERLPEPALAELERALEQAEKWRGRPEGLLLGERAAVVQPLGRWRFSEGWRGEAERWLAAPLEPYLLGVVDAQRAALGAGDLVGLRALEARYLDDRRLALGTLFVSRPRLALARWYASSAIAPASAVLSGLTLAESEVLGLRLALAGERFRRRAGHAPEALADFGPVGRAADPFSPARRLHMQGGRVYSLAWDARDEGGEHPLTPRAARAGEPGDWVLWEAP